jgi:hypothetical protein
MFVEAESSDTPARRTCFGASTLLLLDDGTGTGMQMAPQLGANLVPGGLLYDGTGTYTVTVQVGKLYHYAPGTNETSLVNGMETLTVAGDFIAQGTTVVLHGTIGQPITAFVNQLVYLDQDQSDARYLHGGDLVTIQDEIDTINAKLSARAFDSIALLRANLIYQDGWVYMVLGNNARGDGGAAIYYYDVAASAPDDGGANVTPNNITRPDPGGYLQFSF